MKSARGFINYLENSPGVAPWHDLGYIGAAASLIRRKPRMNDNLDALYRRVSWRLMPFLFLCFVAAYLDRVNVGFAKLQMLSDLRFSDTVYGVGAGMFFIGYFLFEVPSNLLMTRAGARLWIARIMISWGVISSAMMFTNSVTTFYVLRFLLGAAEAGFFPGIILYLTYWYPAHRRARMEIGRAHV